MPAPTTVVVVAAVVIDKFRDANRSRDQLHRLYKGPMILPMIIGPFGSPNHPTNHAGGV